MDKSIHVKAVLGFDGLPYSDSNQYIPNRPDIWLFYIFAGAGVTWGYIGPDELRDLKVRELPKV